VPTGVGWVEESHSSELRQGAPTNTATMQKESTQATMMANYRYCHPFVSARNTQNYRTEHPTP